MDSTQNERRKMVTIPQEVHQIGSDQIDQRAAGDYLLVHVALLRGKTAAICRNAITASAGWGAAIPCTLGRADQALVWAGTLISGSWGACLTGRGRDRSSAAIDLAKRFEVSNAEIKSGIRDHRRISYICLSFWTVVTDTSATRSIRRSPEAGLRSLSSSPISKRRWRPTPLPSVVPVQGGSPPLWTSLSKPWAGRLQTSTLRRRINQRERLRRQNYDIWVIAATRYYQGLVGRRRG